MDLLFYWLLWRDGGQNRLTLRRSLVSADHNRPPTPLNHRLEGKRLLSSDHVWRIKALIFDGPNSGKEPSSEASIKATTNKGDVSEQPKIKARLTRTRRDRWTPVLKSKCQILLLKNVKLVKLWCHFVVVFQLDSGEIAHLQIISSNLGFIVTSLPSVMKIFSVINQDNLLTV